MRKLSIFARLHFCLIGLGSGRRLICHIAKPFVDIVISDDTGSEEGVHQPANSHRAYSHNHANDCVFIYPLEQKVEKTKQQAEKERAGRPYCDAVVIQRILEDVLCHNAVPPVEGIIQNGPNMRRGVAGGKGKMARLFGVGDELQQFPRLTVQGITQPTHTIPEALYDFVDIERMRNQESRSAFIARVLEAASKKKPRSKRK